MRLARDVHPRARTGAASSPPGSGSGYEAVKAAAGSGEGAGQVRVSGGSAGQAGPGDRKRGCACGVDTIGRDGRAARKRDRKERAPTRSGRHREGAWVGE
ncbi:hypothetical protein GCM10027203_23440 [Nonomuraea fastidiosa]